MKKLTVIVMLIGAVSSFSTGSGEIFREIGQEQQLQTYYDVPLEKELQDHIKGSMHGKRHRHDYGTCCHGKGVRL